MKKNFFLDHPIFSIVVSIVILLVGAIGLMLLPIDQYPQIVPPVVKITASYPGADAQTVTQAVATPIEQELNGPAPTQEASQPRSRSIYPPTPTLLPSTSRTESKKPNRACRRK